MLHNQNETLTFGSRRHKHKARHFGVARIVCRHGLLGATQQRGAGDEHGQILGVDDIEQTLGNLQRRQTEALTPRLDERRLLDGEIARESSEDRVAQIQMNHSW